MILEYQTFSGYHNAVTKAAQYPNKGKNFVYPALKLAGEAGEVADKIGKLWRNHGVVSMEEMRLNPILQIEGMYNTVRLEIIKELGDVLWYIDALAKELDCSLEDVALININKVSDRVRRGVVKSEGDNR